MPSNPLASVEDEIAHQEQLRRSALGILDAYGELRALCPGFFADIVSEEHDRAMRQYTQSSQWLAEQKPKILPQPEQRTLIMRLIGKFQPGDAHSIGGQP